MPAPIASAFLFPLVEGAAAAIGAGVVVGTFGGATAGLVFRLSRKQVEGDALRDGYFGALTALVLWIVEGRNV